jgi:hypothetical protein
MLKFESANAEAENLEEELKDKQDEFDKVNFKYSKAKSHYIETMRELGRFRDEFSENYSLRSKMKRSKEVCKEIDGIMVQKQQTLAKDKAKLVYFQKAAT